MKTKIKYILLILIGLFSFREMPAQLYDNSFNGTGIWTRQVRNSVNYLQSITLQPDGKILYVGGTEDAPYVAGNFAIGRIKADGTNDNTFDTDGIAEYIFTTDGYDEAYSACYLNGKIYVAASNVNSGVASTLLVRLNGDGSVDNTFNGTGKLAPTIESVSNSSYVVVKTSDDKIIVLGASATTTPTFHLSGFKVDENANYVTGFGNSGKSILNVANGSFSTSSVQMLNNNVMIMVFGRDLIKVKENGHLDSTFGTNGIVSLNALSSNDMEGLAVQKDGKIIVCSTSSTYHFAVYRLNSNGSLDNSFGTNGTVIVPFAGNTSIAKTVVVDTSSVTGKIFVAGSSFYSDGRGFYTALARISPSDGTIEAQAEFKTNNLESQALNILLQQDGKLLLGMNYMGYYPESFIVARINPNFSTLIATGVQESQSTLSTGINIFPNPASQNINVHSVYNIEQIKVIDVLGNEVINVTSSGNTQVDISTLPKGLYNFVITTDKGIGSKKVSVQ